MVRSLPLLPSFSPYQTYDLYLSSVPTIRCRPPHRRCRPTRSSAVRPPPPPPPSCLLIAQLILITFHSYHADPSGTFMRYHAKAIGSGSEGAQSELQDSYDKVRLSSCFPFRPVPDLFRAGSP